MRPSCSHDYDELTLPAGQLGRKATVTFTKDMSKSPVQFAVVEAGDVIVSYDFNGSPVAGNGRAAGIQLAYETGMAAG